VDLTEYRASPAEQKRTADLLRLIPTHGRSALDIGARDGHFSRLLAERFDQVTALDLTEPDISHPRAASSERSPEGRHEACFLVARDDRTALKAAGKLDPHSPEQDRLQRALAEGARLVQNLNSLSRGGGAMDDSYAQFCTVARGAEALCQRWTSFCVP
jgi:hypothetical protein